jgi:Ca2+-binding EF-hand superfamily protein
MKIRIIENEKPDLPLCNMACDKPLASHLDNYEVTKFMNKHSVNLLIGKPGSGKTSLLYSFFKKGGKGRIFKKVFHNIYLFMPENSRSSLKDNIFDKLPDDKKYSELTYENLDDVMNRIKGTDLDENNCIIFDDMGAFLKNNDTRKLFKELVYNRRHLRTSIFFLVQSWLSIEKDLRKLFTNIVCFKISKSEMENLFNEVIEQKKDYILDIMKVAYDKPHQWLFINTDTGRLFKMWDELLLEDESDDE